MSVFSLHEHELKNNIDVMQYEKDVGAALEKINVPGLLQAYHLKGFKGGRNGSYAVLWILASKEDIEKNFGTLENRKWPESWLYYENEVLAKYLTCHPDEIHFTDYEPINEFKYFGLKSSLRTE